MSDLLIFRAKPNPNGKDRRGPLTTNSQLNGEWVDIYNSSDKNLTMEGVGLYDHTFSGYCVDNGKRRYYVFPNWSFPKGKIVRVHSGNKPTQLSYEDSNGADFHAYTDSDYVLNNSCGDKIEVRNALGGFIDDTSFVGNVPNGKVLTRKGVYLV